MILRAFSTKTTGMAVLVLGMFDAWPAVALGPMGSRGSCPSATVCRTWETTISRAEGLSPRRLRITIRAGSPTEVTGLIISPMTWEWPRPSPALAGGSDYAFGGASTGAGTTTYAPGQAVPNVGTQIAMYLSTHTPTSGELFTIWAGANNLLIGNQTNPIVPAQDIANEITTLANAGAKQFLIPNLPLLGDIPATSGFSAAERQALDAWSVGFNQTLAAEATALQKSLGVQIHLVNIQGLFEQVLANPASYGFTNVTGSAINPSLNGMGYLFWDAEHPTTAADAIIAETGRRIGARAVDVL